MHPSSSRRLRAWIVLVVLLGTGLRLYRLEARAAWIDEVYRVLWAKGYETDHMFGFLPRELGTRLPPRDLKSALRVVNAHNPPLNALVLYGWMRAAGSDGDFAARFPSAIFGALSIVGTWLAGRRLLGACGGAWAATLVALSPFHVFYAQEINHYALAACLIAFSFWCYFAWWERRSFAWGAGLAVTGGAALYTHYYAGLVLLFQGLALLLGELRRPPGERLRGMAASIAPYLVMAAGFVPYLKYLRRQLPELMGATPIGSFLGFGYFQRRTAMAALLPFTGDVAEGFPTWLAWSLAGAAIVLVVVGARTLSDDARRRMLLLNAFGPMVLVATLYWVLRTNSILWPRYQLFFTFAQFFAVAAALDAIRRRAWVVVIPLAVAAATGLRLDYSAAKEDWKRAANAIASARDDASVVVYLPNLTYSLARYLPTGNRLFGVGNEPDLARKVTLAADGRDATWWVVAWPPPGDAALSTVEQLLSCRYEKRERFPVDPGRVGLTVTRYSQARVPLTPPCDQPLMPEAAAPWERAAPGPVTEDAAIDFPASGTPVPAGPSMTVSGYAFSTAGARAIAYEVDGRELTRGRHLGLIRDDVAVSFPPAAQAHAKHSGFWAVVATTGLSPGRHELVLRIQHEDGSWATLARRPFTVLEPGARLSVAAR